jgi:hypothetical protein
MSSNLLHMAEDTGVYPWLPAHNMQLAKTNQHMILAPAAAVCWLSAFLLRAKQGYACVNPVM